MKKKDFLGNLNHVCNLINTVPLDNYTMVLDIAALIIKNFLQAESSMIFLSRIADNDYTFFLISHSIPFEEAKKIDTYEPLPLFNEMLKTEKFKWITADEIDVENSYITGNALLAPLISNGQPFGIVVVNNPAEESIKTDNKIFLSIVFTLISNLISNAVLLKAKSVLLKELDEKHHELENSIYQITELTSSLIGTLQDVSLFRDYETGLHLLRVRKYSEILARGAGLDEQMIYKIGIYSGIHDIGKIAIKLELLSQPRKYTPEEFEEIKKHSTLGYELIDRSGIDRVAKNIVLYHHERYDGSGYPTGKSGDDIPIEGRIVAIADVYDALTTKRVYKEVFPDKEAEEYLIKESGGHFDPFLVSVFIKNIDTIRAIRKQLK